MVHYAQTPSQIHDVHLFFALIRKYPELRYKRLQVVQLERILHRESRSKLMNLCYRLLTSFWYPNTPMFRNALNATKDLQLVLAKTFVQVLDNSVVIVPGDSPSRIPLLMRLLFGRNDEMFDFNREFDLVQDNERFKRLYFVEFAASKLMPKHMHVDARSHARAASYVKSKVPAGAMLYLLDFQFTGKAFQFFRELYPNIQLVQSPYVPAAIPGMVPDADDIGARCTPHLEPGTSPNDLNDYMLCNLSVLFLYLRMTYIPAVINMMDRKFFLQNQQLENSNVLLAAVDDIAEPWSTLTVKYYDSNGQTKTVANCIMMKSYKLRSLQWSGHGQLSKIFELLIIPQSRANVVRSMLATRASVLHQMRGGNLIYLKGRLNIGSEFKMAVRVTGEKYQWQNRYNCNVFFEYVQFIEGSVYQSLIGSVQTDRSIPHQGDWGSISVYFFDSGSGGDYYSKLAGPCGTGYKCSLARKIDDYYVSIADTCCLQFDTDIDDPYVQYNYFRSFPHVRKVMPFFVSRVYP